MSTSTKTRASIRQGGPGAAHENAKARTEIKKPPRTIRNGGTAGCQVAVANMTVTIAIDPRTSVAVHDRPQRQNNERETSQAQQAHEH